MNGDADIRFDDYLAENKIKHIEVRVKHPPDEWRTGKIE
jgi:hypothetical protein